MILDIATQCHYAESCILNSVTLNVLLLSVVISTVMAPLQAWQTQAPCFKAAAVSTIIEVVFLEKSITTTRKRAQPTLESGNTR